MKQFILGLLIGILVLFAIVPDVTKAGNQTVTILDENATVAPYFPEITRSQEPPYFQMVDAVDENVGRPMWQNGRFHFEGNATASARAFLDELNRQGYDICTGEKE